MLPGSSRPNARGHRGGRIGSQSRGRIHVNVLFPPRGRRRNVFSPQQANMLFPADGEGAEGFDTEILTRQPIFPDGFPSNQKYKSKKNINPG